MREKATRMNVSTGLGLDAQHGAESAATMQMGMKLSVTTRPATFSVSNILVCRCGGAAGANGAIVAGASGPPHSTISAVAADQAVPSAGIAAGRWVPSLRQTVWKC